MNNFLPNVNDVRREFIDRLDNEDFVTDKTGVKTIEIIGLTFLADEDAIFGEVNWDYVEREIAWYESKSLYVKDIPGKTPDIWNQVSDKNGKINSNYGWCLFSGENGFQYDHVLHELLNNPNSRRAQAIFTRPQMWNDYNHNGRSDFMCTDAYQFFIRDDALSLHVRMRSNDMLYGYKNDRAFANYVLDKLVKEYNKFSFDKVIKGDIIWTAGSAHIYDRHFHLVK